MVVGAGEGDGGFPVVADFDDNDVEMDSFDDEEPSSSSAASTSTNSTQTSPALNHAVPGMLSTFTRGNAMSAGMNQLGLVDAKRAAQPTPPVRISSPREEKESAFDTFLVTSPPGSSFNNNEGVSTSFTTKSGIDGKKATLTYTKRTLPTTSRSKASTQISNAFGANVRNAEVRTPASRNELAVPPSLLELRSNKTGQVIVPLVLDPKGNVIQPSPSELQKAALNAPAPAQEEEEEEHDVPGEPADAALAPSQFSDYRPYRCNKPGCTKAYKQANGLKYHQSKGQCNFEENYAIAMDGLTLEEAEEKLKPFPCVVGDGCKKRYKQMNGLKVSGKYDSRQHNRMLTGFLFSVSLPDYGRSRSHRSRHAQ
jgi:transcription factor SFP1